MKGAREQLVQRLDAQMGARLFVQRLGENLTHGTELIDPYPSGGVVRKTVDEGLEIGVNRRFVAGVYRVVHRGCELSRQLVSDRAAIHFAQAFAEDHERCDDGLVGDLSVRQAGTLLHFVDESLVVHGQTFVGARMARSPEAKLHCACGDIWAKSWNIHLPALGEAKCVPIRHVHLSSEKYCIACVRPCAVLTVGASSDARSHPGHAIFHRSAMPRYATLVS